MRTYIYRGTEVRNYYEMKGVILVVIARPCALAISTHVYAVELTVRRREGIGEGYQLKTEKSHYISRTLNNISNILLVLTTNCKHLEHFI